MTPNRLRVIGFHGRIKLCALFTLIFDDFINVVHQTCTLDILMHLPRSVFSHRQLDLFLWLLKVNGVDDVPSVKTMQNVNAALQKMCGVESISYNGALGHRYFVNSLSQIIAQVCTVQLWGYYDVVLILTSTLQEMGNPQVRPHLSFYPEDSGPHLSEARQGRRWLYELPSDQMSQMARIDNHDYFIYEPAMLRNGECCIPIRWFKRCNILYAQCWQMVVVTGDGRSGWRVIQSIDYEVSENDFMKNFPSLKDNTIGAQLHGLPSPSSIIGQFLSLALQYVSLIH